MPDHFAVLHQPRRPWLDEAALKDAFHAGMARQHPDVAGGSGEQSAALNAAYAVLRDPASRLRHLVELEWPEAAHVCPGIAPELADLFGRIASLRQAGVALRKRVSAAQSPLSRALLAGEIAAHRQALEIALAGLAGAENSAREELRAIDAAWETNRNDARDRTGALQQRFSFLTKWQAQFREDLFAFGN
jgi:curved DNA-binding protein CbpA